MKFNMSEAWNEAMAMFSANREVLLIVAGIFFFLPSVISAMVMPNFQEQLMADPEAMQAVMAGMWATWGWLIFIMSLAQIVGYLAMLVLLRDHSRPTVGEALQQGLKGLLPAILAYILMGIVIAVLIGAAVALGAVTGSGGLTAVLSILALVVMVYMLVKFSLMPAVIALDKVNNPVAALTRSWKLTKGNSFRILLFYVLLFVCYIVIAVVISIPLGLLAFTAGTVGMFVNGVVSGALGAVVSVIFVAILASMHRQLSGPSVESVGETFD